MGVLMAAHRTVIIDLEQDCYCCLVGTHHGHTRAMQVLTCSKLAHSILAQRWCMRGMLSLQPRLQSGTVLQAHALLAPLVHPLCILMY